MIREADSNDLQMIYDLHLAAFDREWQADDLKSTLAAQHARFLIDIEDNVAIGYICYYNTGDIINVAVLPTNRRQGRGNALVVAAIEAAKLAGMDYLMLEVRQSNVPAYKLYEKIGFELIRSRNRYYNDGETALIYRITL